MSLIDGLLAKVHLPPPISELPSDIEEVPCGHNASKSCLKCKKCGNISGETRKIYHSFTCPYKPKQPVPGPYSMGTRMSPSTRINPELCECILQKEFAIISSNSTKTILGTYGAGPCIILCMRNRTNTNTILAHIPAVATNPLEPFLSFPPEHSDVYVIGVANESRETVTELLVSLRDRGYIVTFAHVVEDSANSFAINCLTGETWLNDEIHMSELPVTINKERREKMLPYVGVMVGPLVNISIPDKSMGVGGKRKNRRNTKRNYRKRRQTSRKI